MVKDNTFEFVAQLSHVGWGALGVLIASLWHVQAAGTVAILAAAAIKEFWYDSTFEPPEVRGSNLLDFLTYCLGAGLGWVVVAAAP